MNAITSFSSDLQKMRAFFDSGQTLSYSFRKEQLDRLKTILKSREKEIYEALHADLNNSPEEVYATELGIVLAEITFVTKRLKKWMKPKRAKTNLLNFPSSAKIYHDPLGVVLIIGSWNYPLQLVLMPLIGAIAGGNCAVLKPSEAAPATSAFIARMMHEMFPPEFIKVYEGEGSEIVPELMETFRFDHIFYTGSTRAGKSVYEAAASKLIPVTLELGGKSPAVIEKDADIKVAARRVVLGKFVNAGQTCVAPDYVLVHYTVREKFLEALIYYIKEFFGNKPAQNPEYGKIITPKRLGVLLSYLDRPEKIVYGGQHRQNELFLEPTILSGITMEDKIMKEEIFGPVLPVLSFTDRAQALSMISQHDKPLSFYLFTRSREQVQWWMTKLTFGGGCINNTLWHLSNPFLPFGGTGGSGFGNYHGKYSFNTFTHTKPVLHTPNWFDPDIKYPPFSGKLPWLKRMLK